MGINRYLSPLFLWKGSFKDIPSPLIVGLRSEKCIFS
jgi:hypothetical protein